MLFTRASAVLVGGGIIAALIASPTLMRTGPRMRAEPTRPFAAEPRPAEIAPMRLEALLARRSGGAGQGSRNPFVFATRPQPAAPATKPAPAPVSVEAPIQAPRPPVTLAAIADQAGENGAVIRTAVLSVSGQIVLVKEGERAASRFTAVRISADVVELRDEATGILLRLALK